MANKFCSLILLCLLTSLMRFKMDYRIVFTAVEKKIQSINMKALYLINAITLLLYQSDTIMFIGNKWCPDYAMDSSLHLFTL